MMSDWRMKDLFLRGIIFWGMFGISFSGFSQQGIGTEKPSKAAALEIRSSVRGLLIPRVKLEMRNQFSPPIVSELAPDNEQVRALLVYNTANHNDVQPGFYYWSTQKQKWFRLIADGEQAEPWQIQGTTVKAVSNTDDIYQQGTVAIGKTEVGKDSTDKKVQLDVEGVIRGGKAQEEKAIGTYTIAVGKNVEASGDYSVAFGNSSRALDFNAFAAGHRVRAEGNSSVAMGRNTIATGNYAMALGKNTQAKGYYSLTMGDFIISKTSHETVFGRYNALFSGNTIRDWKPNDPLFVIGNGSGLTKNRKNALTILKNGKMGIGIDGYDDLAKPTEMFDLGKGRLRVRKLPDTQGAIIDRIVVVNNKGILGSLNPKELKSQGPWFKQESMDPTTDNNEKIYQTGAVAIGRKTGLEHVMLDVQGAIRGGDHYSTGVTTQIGENSLGVGQYVAATEKNSTAFGYSSSASAEGAFAAGGFTGAAGGKASGKSSFAFGYNAKASEKYAVAMGDRTEASNYYSFAMGRETQAKGSSSVALGKDTRALGNYSLAVGRGSLSNSLSSTSFGQYNIGLSGSPTRWNAKDPLFEIGNGQGENNRSNALTIHKNGWTGIGYTSPELDSIENEKLSVNGAVFAKENLYTTTTMYPDYVFEKYYGHPSKNTEYHFKSLDEYENYVKKERHLPGVPSTENLMQTSDGRYILNASQLTVKTLKKIEELFLYIFEQEEKIDSLRRQLNVLKKEIKLHNSSEKS